MVNKEKLKKYALPFDEVLAQTMTPEEIRDLDLRVRLKIAMRKLKQAREKQGWTQEDLARRSGISRTSIAKIEAGLRNSSIYKIMKIADALGKTVEIELADYTKVK